MELGSYLQIDRQTESVILLASN